MYQEQQDDVRKIFGIRAIAVVEVAIIIGVLLLLSPVLSGNRYFDWSPHPFWVAVLLVTVQYGTAEGVFAALISSIVLLLGNMPEQMIDQDRYAYLYVVMKNPILWLLAAVALGELRLRHVRERNELRSHLAEATERENTIATAYERVRGLKERLELRIAGQFRSTLAAYRAAKEIEKLHPTEVLHGVQEIIGSVLNPEKYSIWLLNKDGLTPTVTHGWREQDGLLRRIDADSDLYKSIIGKQEILHVANTDLERSLHGQGVMAGPLFARETGEIVGMLKIEKLGFLELNLTTIETFSTICEWVAMALVNARKYQEAKADTVYNPDHNLMTFSYFQRYVDYITALARRLKFDVNMIVVSLANSNNLTEEERVIVARTLGSAVNDVLRAVDLAFDYHKTGVEYSIMLPATNRAGTEIVLGRIKQAIAQRLPERLRGVDFSYAIQNIHEVA